MSRRDKYNNKPKKQLSDISPDAKKRAALLVANSILLTVIYFGAMALDEPILSMIVTLGFFAGFGSFAVAYVVYNRGFTRRNVTLEMLPDHWSAERKAEYIEDGRRRYEGSKWMLSVIIPLMIPIAFDAISLFTWPIIQNLFNLN